MGRKKRRGSATRRWHRFFGTGSSIFVLLLVLTGLALNHSPSLGLDHRHVSNSYLLSWYGLGQPKDVRSFAVGDDWLSFAGSQVYLNDQVIASVSEGVGAVSNGELLIVASNRELLLFDLTGSLVERQPWDRPGATAIDAIGSLASGAVVLRAGGMLWLTDQDMLRWHRLERPHEIAVWSQAGTTPGDLQVAISEQYRGDGPSLERLLLDLHSGRIFGPIGVIIYDLFALALGFLAISGLILWLRSRR